MLQKILREVAIIFGGALLCFAILQVVAHEVMARTATSVTGSLGEEDGRNAETIELDSRVLVEGEVTLQGEQATYFLKDEDGARIPLQSKKREMVASGYLVERFTFLAPRSGEVKVQLWAENDPEASLLYYFTFKRRFELGLDAKLEKRKNGSKGLKILASLVGMDDVVVKTEDPGEVRAQVFTPDGETAKLDLRDDGRNGDLRAGDGIYTGRLAPDVELADSGVHKVAAIFKGTPNEDELLRRAEKKFMVR